MASSMIMAIVIPFLDYISTLEVPMGNGFRELYNGTRLHPSGCPLLAFQTLSIALTKINSINVWQKVYI